MNNEKAQLLEDEGSFERFGLDRHNIVDWEDGMRLKAPYRPGEFEWWYVDAHLSDGYFCVASLHIDIDANSLNKPFVNLNIVHGDEVLCDMKLPIDESACSFSDERCDIIMGNHEFQSLDGYKRYRVYISPEDSDGYGLDLIFESSVPPYRPATGFSAIGERYFAWLAAVPGARVKGRLFIKDKVINVEGNGYHDHNWGNVPIDHLVSDWLWGRADVDGIITIASSTKFRPECGATEVAMLYVARAEDGTVLVDRFGKGVTCLEGVKVNQPDTRKFISSDCIYVVEDSSCEVSVRFNGQRNIISSFRFAHSSPEWETWSTRYGANITVRGKFSDGEIVNVEGPGTLENLDFFARKINISET